jgi:hypothetical protein
MKPSARCPVFRGSPARPAPLVPPATWSVLMEWAGNIPPKVSAKLWQQFSTDRSLAWQVWSIDKKLQRGDRSFEADLVAFFGRWDPERFMAALEQMVVDGTLAWREASQIEEAFLGKLNQRGQWA